MTAHLMQNILTLAGLAALLLAIVALFKPSLFLGWAADGKRTRVRACLFWVLAAFLLLGAGAALAASEGRNLWVGPAIFGAALAGWAYYLYKFNPKILERQQQKRAEKEQRQQTRQEQPAETQSQCQPPKEAELPQEDKARPNPTRIDVKPYIPAGDAGYKSLLDDDILGPDDYTEERDFAKEWDTALKEYFGKKIPYDASEKLRKRFDRDLAQSVFNFYMYDARMRRGEIYCIVPKDDYYRRRFDTLAKRGMAIKFTQFDKEVLSALTLTQLREIGRAAGFKSLRRDKAGSCKMLWELPDDVLLKAWDAAGIDLDSIYKLRKLEDVYAEITTKGS